MLVADAHDTGDQRFGERPLMLIGKDLKLGGANDQHGMSAPSA